MNLKCPLIIVRYEMGQADQCALTSASDGRIAAQSMQPQSGTLHPGPGAIVKRVPIVEIVKDGIIETDDHLMDLTEQYGQVVIPSENEDLDLTHWWVIRHEGSEMLYVGTAETFDTYVRERNGGVQ